MTCEHTASVSKPRQVAVIATRSRGTELQPCLIRKNDSAKWAIPKSFTERGDTAKKAALTEAREEAGILGRIVGFVGCYNYTKGNVTITVAVYLMEVREVQAKWLEMNFRHRAWFSAPEAYELLASHPVYPLLGSAFTTLNSRVNDLHTEMNLLPNSG